MDNSSTFTADRMTHLKIVVSLNRGRSESEKVSSMSPVCTVPLGPCYARLDSAPWATHPIGITGLAVVGAVAGNRFARW